VHITKVIITNFKCLKSAEIEFKDKLNILVGNNEEGKSTILEAINLALSGQLNGRYAQYELHPFLFNAEAVSEYLEALGSGEPLPPPTIEVEVFLSDCPELVFLKGSVNSKKEDVPGVKFSIEFDERFNSEYASYISDHDSVRTLPVEYYKINWISFSNDIITSRSIPIKPCLIDASSVGHNLGANKYVVDIMKDFLSEEERAKLSITYRKMKDVFTEDPIVKGINKKLEETEDTITHKKVSISLDSSSKSKWENGIETQIDNLPVSMSGKGEQNSIKIQLAMDSNSKNHLFLIEEPENHLSFVNLNKLINRISKKGGDKQLIVTTHSNFVLNKLGVENVKFLAGNKAISIESLSEGTQGYFMKLPGHDTLRLITSGKAILVEGPSDELIVQKAFIKKFGCMPLENGVDVITVRSLAFKRFLEISKQLGITTVVVTDNDGNASKVEEKYSDFSSTDCIHIKYDENVDLPTLEPQMLNANSLTKLNEVFDTSYESDDEILAFMTGNKTEWALRVFNYEGEISFPKYIEEAINVK